MLAQLTTVLCVGIFTNMDAVPIIDKTREYWGGRIVEIVVWEVPEPVAGSAHLYKYRLFFGEPGRRLVGFDNERGKGDHRHEGDMEYPYAFTDIPTLLRDFRAAIDRWEKSHDDPDHRD